MTSETTTNQDTKVSRGERADNTRSRKGRQDSHEEFNFSLDEDRLAIPREVTERFKAQGLSLRWIRYRQGDKEDYQNISRKARIGWKFVSPDDVPEMGIMTQLTDFGRHKGLVAIEDVALAACKTSNLRQLEKLKAEKARRQMQAENEKLDGYDSHGMHIRNKNKSSVSNGRKVAFEDSSDDEG